jgi:hypothetical protein
MSDFAFAVDLFVTRKAAERALRSTIAEEPAFEPLLSIVLIEPPWSESSWPDLAASLQ